MNAKDCGMGITAENWPQGTPANVAHVRITNQFGPDCVFMRLES